MAGIGTRLKAGSVKAVTIPSRGTPLVSRAAELHLHPLAQRPLATVFVDAVRKRGVHIVAETHSRWSFGQFQREIREQRLQMDEIALYRVRRGDGKSHIEPIKIDGNGEIFHDWKQGFCD